MNRRQLLLTALAGFGACAHGAQLPRAAPPLKFISHNGQQIDLASYKGKVVLLEWLMTTCPHCQESSRILSKIQTEFAAKGVQVLGVAIDAGAGQKLPDYVRKYATTFPVGVLPHTVATDFLQASVMAPLMMPQVVIVDRQGQIREQYAGDDKWHQQAEKNLRSAIAKYAAHGAGAPAKRAAKRK